jgi:hypothetical protein
MSWVAVGVGGAAVVAGAGINYLGQQQAAGAAQSAATAQAEVAGATRNQILNESGRLERDAMPLADATPEELAALSRSNESARSALSREERLMSAIDPSLMEASKQALSLLRGDTTASNKPMMDMRANQRQNLVNSLRSQYGSGAESSSIGQKALRQFDMESDSIFQSNQQSSLAQMFGIATTDLGARQQRAIAGLQQVGQGYSALQERKLNTRLNLGATQLGALSGTSQQMIQSAGAPFVGAALNGQAISSLGGSVANAGTTLGSAYLLGGGFGGAKKT